MRTLNIAKKCIWMTLSGFRVMESNCVVGNSASAIKFGANYYPFIIMEQLDSIKNVSNYKNV